MKMQKTLLRTAIIAGLGSPFLAGATIHVTTDGLGEALLYPYYSAMNGNETFVTVTNTTSVPKAVKVRFREGVGSRDVLDFTLYLSKYDMWTGIIYKDGQGTVRATTNDLSCTVPDVSSNKPAFNPTRIPSEYNANEVNDRLAEGHLELIEMATLADDNDVYDDLAAVITHSNGVPVSCDAARAWTANVAIKPFGDGSSFAVTDGQTLTGTVPDVGDATQRFLAPTGGMYGHAAVYNPTDGIYYTYQASALEGLTDNDPYWFPQNSQDFDALDVLTEDQGLAFDGGQNQGAAANVEYFDLPDLSTPEGLFTGKGVVDTRTFVAGQYLNDFTAKTAAATTIQFSGALSDPGGQIGSGTDIGSAAALAKANAVTAALTRASLSNDFITGTDFETEFVITFPTRYLHVDADNDSVFISAEPPFTEEEDRTTGQACETIGTTVTDREETREVDPGSIDFSPGGETPTLFKLCYEVNVLAINQDTSLSTPTLSLKALSTKQAGSLPYENGWVTFDFSQFDSAANGLRNVAASATWSGLPVVGFSAVANTSGAVPVGGTFVHHTSNAIPSPAVTP